MHLGKRLADLRRQEGTYAREHAVQEGCSMNRRRGDQTALTHMGGVGWFIPHALVGSQHLIEAVLIEKVRSLLRFAICCILIVTTQPPESVHRFPSTCTAQLGNHLLSVSKLCP